MNLTKTIHDHLFANASSIVDALLVTGLTECPLGHSSCQVSWTDTLTLTAYNEDRLTDLTANLLAKSHKHDLQKKTITETYTEPCYRAFSNGNPLLMECELGHTNCKVGQELPVSVYKLAISGFGGGEAALLTSPNLTKMLHAHTVVLSRCNVTRESVVRAWATCAADHEDCILDPVAAVTAWSMADVTTSEEGG